MLNILSYFKYYNKNLYSLAVSLLLSLWYNGVSGLLTYYWPNRGLMMSFIFLLLPIIVFLSDDGSLDELYRPPSLNFPVFGGNNNQQLPAIVTSAYINQQQPRRSERFK